MTCYQRRMTDNAENFTPAERAYIRNELDRYFTTFPTVAEGLMLRTWKTGPRAGQPKMGPAAQSRLGRAAGDDARPPARRSREVRPHPGGTRDRPTNELSLPLTQLARHPPPS